MLGAIGSQPNAEGSAVAAHGPYPNNNGGQKKNNRLWSEHCRRTGHTKETYWKIHGKPTDWKPSSRSSQDSRGNVAATESQSPTELSPFNKGQMEALQNMLQATVQNTLNSGGTSIATMAQQGNSFTALGARIQDVKPWIVDSGASDHMTGDLNSFEEYKPCSGGKWFE